MSGSPIIQDGKPIGAITHVLVNDPTYRIQDLYRNYAGCGGIIVMPEAFASGIFCDMCYNEIRSLKKRWGLYDYLDQRCVWSGQIYSCGSYGGKMENALVFDAEEVGNAVRDNYPDCPYGYIFEDYPLWGEVCYLLLKDIHNHFHRDILVPMTLLRRESYKIIQKLKDEGIETELIILEADYQTIHDRILNRGEEEGCWCMENIELAREGSALLPGIHIATTQVSVDTLMTRVFSELGIKTVDPNDNHS